MEIVPDHPVIRNMMSSGYPDGKELSDPICPVCGEECSTVFKDIERNIVGCENCIIELNAYDEL
ncbi:MAG: hypothetical protein ACI3VY_01865 [Faecousia sp.]